MRRAEASLPVILRCMEFEIRQREDPCSMSHRCHCGSSFGNPIGLLACKKRADGYSGRKNESFEASVWMEGSAAGA